MALGRLTRSVANIGDSRWEKVICPSRQIAAKQKFCFSEIFLTPPPNQLHDAASRPGKRGVTADRHETWDGDVVDASAARAIPCVDERSDRGR